MMARRKQTEEEETVQQLEQEEPEQFVGGPTHNVRPRYVPKTPDQVILEQIQKQQRRVDIMREELAAEEHQLERLNRAKRALEAD